MCVFEQGPTPDTEKPQLQWAMWLAPAVDTAAHRHQRWQARTHLCLDVASVDAQAAAPNLHPVVDHVVGKGAGIAQVTTLQAGHAGGIMLFMKPAARRRGQPNKLTHRQVIGVGCGEGVVQRLQAPLLLIPLKHGKVDHPQQRVLALLLGGKTGEAGRSEEPGARGAVSGEQ